VQYCQILSFSHEIHFENILITYISKYAPFFWKTGINYVNLLTGDIWNAKPSILEQV
jgi:hypothetical protein